MFVDYQNVPGSLGRNFVGIIGLSHYITDDSLLCHNFVGM